MAVLEEPIKEILEVKNYIDGEWVGSKGEVQESTAKSSAESRFQPRKRLMPQSRRPKQRSLTGGEPRRLPVPESSSA
jgi:hypothetical protein